MSNLEPMRKPVRNGQHRIRKHRANARLVHSRLFRVRDHFYLYTGTPDFVKLAKVFKDLSTGLETDQHLRTMAALGATGVELNKPLLQRISYHVLQWSEWLRKHKRFAGRSREVTELQQIQLRLAFFQECLEAKPRWRPTQNECLLTPIEEEKLTLLTGRSEDGFARDLLPFEKDLVRIAFWFGGIQLAMRLANSLRQVPAEEDELFERTHHLIGWLESLERRLQTQSSAVVKCEFKNHPKFKALVRRYKRLVGWKHEPQSGLAESIDWTKNKFVQQMGLIRYHTEQKFPSVIAAWVICDTGFETLPRTLLGQLRFGFHRNLIKMAQRYIRLSHWVSYDSFLAYLQRYDHGTELATRQLRQIVAWLARGQAEKDIQSAICSRQVHLRLDTDLRTLRQLKSLHRELFGSLPNELEDGHFSPATVTLSNFHCVLHWLNQISPNRFPEGTYTECMTNYLPTLNRLSDEFNAKRIEERVREWAAIMQSDEFGFPGERECPKELRTWLRRLGGYQQLTGEERRIPKSVDRFLSHQIKLSKELAYLSQRMESGGLGESARARFEYLGEKLKDSAKAGFDILALVEKTKLACLRAGLNALREVLKNELNILWREAVGDEPRSWSSTQLLDFLAWSRELPGVEKKLFRQVLNAWREHGKAYKSHFDFNQRWIERASFAGVKVPQWLNPDLACFRIEKDHFSIEVCQDPFETFLMGEHFRTCLSFTGCNSDSILANAAHANKQVILVRNEWQQVVSRMLVALNESFELIRFECYVHNQNDIEYFGTKLTKEVTRYCQRWAEEIGVKLGKSGLPANLGAHFWYDDGVQEFEM